MTKYFPGYVPTSFSVRRCAIAESAPSPQTIAAPLPETVGASHALIYRAAETQSPRGEGGFRGRAAGPLLKGVWK